MIISTNKNLHLKEFEKLCQRACFFMNEKAQAEPDYYLSKGAQKLEPEVKKALDDAAAGTAFEGTIEIVSGQRFPDIVAAKYFGVEVKTTKDDKWTMIGGSVAEGTRVEDVEHIFFLFGKLHKPVEFRTRRYEECLCDIAVTHSPRYKIDMNLSEGETIFDKMGISYNDMRKLENPIEPVVEYFRSILKPGESLWWVNGKEAEESSVPAKLRLWKTLPKEEKADLVSQGFALFPELFSNSSKKYERFALWLAAHHGVVSSSIRDPFSAGGTKDLIVRGVEYKRLPQKYVHLYRYRRQIENLILGADEKILIETWNESGVLFQNRIDKWIQLVSEKAKSETFDVKGFLTDMFEE